MTYQPRTPQPYNDNPFGFVYGDALTANVDGAVNVHPISYDAGGVTVAANVYTPAGYREDGSYAGIVVGHPNGADHRVRCRDHGREWGRAAQP